MVFGVVGHGDGFIDQQDRNTVLDAICTAEARVVQEFVVHQEKRSAVLGADQDGQQFFVQHQVSEP
jgi:hypothetical protein